jgi:hypothetical protein
LMGEQTVKFVKPINPVETTEQPRRRWHSDWIDSVRSFGLQGYLQKGAWGSLEQR